MKNTNKILAVPTNIITGFLGVGKTSAIMHLLKQKPQHERWAILVNEFGEIGIDGSLFSANSLEKNNVFIKELPGGCMCCTAGAPMRITLNKLLHTANPDRLLIEPTGLGHPLEVLTLLSNELYRDVLNVQNTLTLVDARNLADTRYTEHQTFTQQIQIADVVIGNKADLYDEQDKNTLNNYLIGQNKSSTQLFFAEHGEISLDWLNSKNNKKLVSNNFSNELSEEHENISSHSHVQGNTSHSHHEHHHQKEHEKIKNQASVNTQPFPESGIIKAENKGEGFHSIGWRFSPKHIFNQAKLLDFLNHLNVLRVKGVFITNEGIFSYNKAGSDITKTTLDKSNESRIEIINETVNNSWQKALMQTLINNK